MNSFDTAMADIMRRCSVSRPCIDCKTAMVEGPYLCDDCAARAEARRLDESYSTACESIPLKYRWATRESESLLSRVVGGGNTIRVAIEDAIARKSLVLVGDTGHGKTSMACACMRAVIDAGKGDAVHLRDRMRSAGCRFVDAYAIAKCRTQAPLGCGEAPEMASALRASLLVLDELGGERHDVGPVAELLHERHASDRQTIVTTPLTQVQVADRYGDGIARRIWDGTVLNLGGRQ
jgi:hypothetical protein